MIGSRIYKSLDEDSKKYLHTKSDMWIWKSHEGEDYYDGVTMLQILVTKVNPSTRVGVSDLKEKLRRVKLSNHSDDVHEMLEYMQDNYSKILQAGGSHEDYLMDLYNALLTTKNDVFRDVIQQSKDDWEVGRLVLMLLLTK